MLFETENEVRYTVYMKYIILSALYLLVLFSVSQFIFNPTYLYYEIWWLDIPMHILGGFGVAAFAASIFKYIGIKISFWKLTIFFLVVAVVWELYEYMHDVIAGTEWSGWFDTIKDIVDGFIGSSALYFLIKK
jgi:hypothetical protein